MLGSKVGDGASSKASELRLFFAVDFEEGVRAQIARESQEIRRSFETEPKLRGRKWSWVAEKNYHLTVKFLGATALEKVSEVLEAAIQSLSNLSSFEIEVKGAGAFPRVLWLDVMDPSNTLSEISQKLDQALEPLGFARETRAYVPHLTLARLKDGKPIRADRDLKNEWRERSLGKSVVREVILYQSQTRPTGAVYEAVARIALR
jgi:2'-5' RNA ligase